MLQYGLLALVVICGSSSAAYSSSNQQATYTGTYGNNGQNGAGAGASAGAATGSGVYGNNYGAGSYSDKYPYGNNGAFFGQQQAGGAFPQFPFGANAFAGQQQLQNQYHDFIQNFWKNFGNQQQSLYQQQLAQQQAFQNWQQQQAGNFAGAAAGGQNGFYAPNFAGSSANFGPGGVQQTATLIPANPDSPNVDTRFGGDDKPIVTVSSGPQGFQGVSTSSFSSSSDINGQKTAHREASTSVNDNGKVTTYTVRS